MTDVPMGLEGLSFNKDQLNLLMSIQYYSIRSEASISVSFSKVRKFLMSQEDKSMRLTNYREKKRKWIEKWLEITQKLLDVELLSREMIKSEIDKLDSDKKNSLLVEIATFQPYFELSKNDPIDVRWDNSDRDLYFAEAGQFLKVSSSSIHLAYENFKRCVEKITKKLEKSNWTIALIGIGAALFLFTGPLFAGAIGGIMGLSGAAATSAGLAFLGGGSLAAGGLGMTGGYIALMAGGSILGYGLGSKEYNNRLSATSKEELLMSCSKLFSYLKTKDASRSEKINTCGKAREMQFDFELNSDLKYIDGSESDGEANAIKAATLGAFREILSQDKN